MTNGFEEDFKTFFVEVDGEAVLSERGGYTIGKNTGMNVGVKYTFAKLDNAKSGYSVKVIPNAAVDKDFSFKAGEDNFKFKSISDCTAGFDIECGEESFTIKAKGNLSAVLSAIYPDKAVEIENVSDTLYDDMFTLEIKSYNEKAVVKLNFKVLNEVEGVSLNFDEVVF